jgi:hypothetical protein
MDRLYSELQRLYFLGEPRYRERGTTRNRENHETAASDILTAEIFERGLAGNVEIAVVPTAANGLARMLAIRFNTQCGWKPAAELCEKIRNDLHLPEPAVSVSGEGGFLVWLSFFEPLPAEEISRFAHALLRSLEPGGTPGKALRDLHSNSTGLPELDSVPLVPAFHSATARWSAFIDSSLGSLFVDEPGLGMAPDPDKQADLLSGLESIRTEDFRRAIKMLGVYPLGMGNAETENSPSSTSLSQFNKTEAENCVALSVAASFDDPKSFLLAVMNDPAADPILRVEAAKTLLPYFEKRGS